jgi:site-specific DNA recombinase
MRAVIYARFSSDQQREASIEDQVRQCRAFIAGKDWSFVRAYEDRAMSGASAFRPAYQQMREDSRAGGFDVAVAVSLDRFSRDQEDTAGLYKRLKHLGIPIVTVAEGEVTPLHVACAGAMNSMRRDRLGLRADIVGFKLIYRPRLGSRRQGGSTERQSE